MEDSVHSKVFYPDVPAKRIMNSGLYELLEPPVPIKPEPNNNKSQISTLILPNSTEKTYIPRKCVKSKTQVKTVRDIRKEFEAYINSYLPGDLEKQYKYLLKKIRSGSTRDDNTIELAKKVLKISSPISRATWQVLTNLNVNDNLFPKQYILYNGNTIKVNGSRGGSKKFICTYDISSVGKFKSTQREIKPVKKMRLLQSSLHLGFKPGPLSKKIQLDRSYQRHILGKTKVLPLPEVALEISTAYGTPLEPSVQGYIQNCREKAGVLTEDWVNFACSTVGTLKNDTPVQDCVQNVTFKLNYYNGQTRILMRDNNYNELVVSESYQTNKLNSDVCDNSNVDKEIKVIVEELLNAVDISVNEDSFTIEDDYDNGTLNQINIKVKSKSQKRKCTELRKLDVTVIHMDGTSNNTDATCTELYCTMGCVCQSLKFDYYSNVRLKNNCGRIECMFECKCENAQKYNINDETFKDYIPEFLSLENKINSRLAKEEQKFHQTVYVTEDKKIVLTAKRRNCRMTQKYAAYHNKLIGKSGKICKELSIILPQINCPNVEAFCLVHGVYRCFCGGKFLSSISESITTIPSSSNLTIEACTSFDTYPSPVPDVNDTNSNENNGEENKYFTKSEKESTVNSTMNNCDELESTTTTTDELCDVMEDDLLVRRPEPQIRINPTQRAARTRHYKRKNKASVYSSRNKKIRELELKENRKLPAPNNSRIRVDSGCNSDDSQTSTNMEEYDGTISPVFVKWFLREVENLKTSMSRALLRSPEIKKKSLVPWSILLKWYKEKIIAFLVNRVAPYNLYITQKPEHQSFENFMNINEIRVVDLPKCKPIIRHLLMHAELNEYYVVLIGRSLGWELLGSIKRNIEKKSTISESTKNPIEPSGTSTEHKTEDNSEILPVPVSSDNKNVLPSNVTSSNNTTVIPPDFPKSNQVITKRRLNYKKQHQTKIKLKHSKSVSETPKALPSEKIEDISRWFVMTVENDFTQIRFFRKGFFVNYSSIINAIKMARTKKKIVRLSAQTCSSKGGTTFGMYAVPSDDKYCVLIGPYAMDENLNIECVTTQQSANEQKSLGFWMYSKANENESVLDDPMYYLRAGAEFRGESVTLEDATRNEAQGNKSDPKVPVVLQRYITSQCHEKTEPINVSEGVNKCTMLSNKLLRIKPAQSLLRPELEDVINASSQPAQSGNSPEINQTKVVKPIKISRKNGFYQLAPSGLLKQVSLLKSPTQDPNQDRLTLIPIERMSTSPPVLHITSPPPPESNISEISQYHNLNQILETQTIKNSTGSFFVLNPDQINKKQIPESTWYSDEQLMPTITHVQGAVEDLMQMQGTLNNVTHEQESSKEDTLMQQDIEGYLTVHEVKKNNLNVCNIKEKEFDKLDNRIKVQQYINVRIEPMNIEKLGYIRGRLWDTNISFAFPGFKFTGFYPVSEAFKKINEVFARTVYVPKGLVIEWHVVPATTPCSRPLLSRSSLGPRFILTRQGLFHKSAISFIHNKKALESTPALAPDEVGEPLVVDESFVAEEQCPIVEIDD